MFTSITSPSDFRTSITISDIVTKTNKCNIGAKMHDKMAMYMYMYKYMIPGKNNATVRPSSNASTVHLCAKTHVPRA